MDEDTVIKVEGVYKNFCRSLKRSLAYGTMDMLKNFVGLPADQTILRKGEFWALENISFELKRKEILGVIGLNGSGKSTLLRILSGIFPPDNGKITLKGDVGPLIAVGAGFHPYMTGRENIYLNGTILGMTKKELDDKFDDIVKFAEIGEFLDAPVATYSSGMKVRLGFAIAVHRVPEILLVDEVLSVGDIDFRKKCMDRMNEIKNQSSIIFISHNMGQIERICDKCMFMDKGKVVYYGNTVECIRKYNEMVLLRKVNDRNHLTIYGSTGDINNVKVDFKNNDKKITNEFVNGEDITFHFRFNSKEDFKNPVVGFIILDGDNGTISSIKSVKELASNTYNIKKGENEFTVKVKSNPLLPGRYKIAFRWMTDINTLLIDAGGKEFIIKPTNELVNLEGKIKMNTEWSF